MFATLLCKNRNMKRQRIKAAILIFALHITVL